MAQFPHKIIVPQRPPYLVARPRLLDLLHTIVDRRLITLSAPAGYGKTSLITDFATDQPPLPICWYTLDRFDEDPWVFVGYLRAAVAQAPVEPHGGAVAPRRQRHGRVHRRAPDHRHRTDAHRRRRAQRRGVASGEQERERQGEERPAHPGTLSCPA